MQLVLLKNKLGSLPNRQVNWLSVDPLLDKYPGLSPYNYCLNNPINLLDPDGQAPGDPAKLQQAAHNAVSYVILKQGSEAAYCNLGVSHAFKELTGSNKIGGMSANQMGEYLGNSTEFSVASLDQANEVANDGGIAIASYIANTGSGHVALLVPGSDQAGGTWEGEKRNIPNVMDTGKNKRTESKGINYSFGKNIQSQVVFYVYTGPMIPQEQRTTTALVGQTVSKAAPASTREKLQQSRNKWGILLGNFMESLGL